MNAFTIKDLENLSGIKAHTIRIWEQRYSFLKPQRTDTNIRFYSNEDLKLILNIAFLNKYGFKISNIDKMSAEEMKLKVLSLSNEQANEERIINLLIQAMVDLDLEEFENVLEEYIRTNPFDKTVTQIIFPFLERIGILWLTNHINPSHEHLVSNLVRQKFIVGIEKLGRQYKVDKTLLLFLPENEHHELGLLYAYYMFRLKGVKVIYLGATVPLKDLHYIINRKNPDFVFSHITAQGNYNFERLLTNIENQIPAANFIFSGQVVQQYKKQPPKNVTLKKSLLELNTFINSL